MFSEASGPGIIIEMNALNDAFYLAFIQEWEARTYFDGFCKQLDACEISYTKNLRDRCV